MSYSFLKSKQFIGIAGVLLLLSIFFLLINKKDISTTDDGDRKQQNKITYAMPITVAAIPSYIALKKGFWEEEGLLVEAQMFSAGRLALDALLAGNAEVMSVSETPLVHTIIQGNNIYIVATVTEHKETKAIARRDHGIERPTDFKGKRVATLPGTNSDYFMYEFFEKNNISLDEVKITNMQPPDMVTAFVQGDIDAYFAWEPHIFYGRSKLTDKALVFEPGELYQGRHTVAMNQEFVQENPLIVKQLIRGFLRAEKFIQENPVEAKNIVSNTTGMDKEALESLWNEYRISVQLDVKFLEILEKEGRWALTIKKSADPLPNFKEYIYTSALKDARRDSVEF